MNKLDAELQEIQDGLANNLSPVLWTVVEALKSKFILKRLQQQH